MIAMRNRLLTVIIILCLLSVPVGGHQTAGGSHLTSSVRPMQAHLSAMHRGHKWVRSHPFTIMGLTRMHPSPFDIDQYRGAGFNVLLAWEPGTFDKLLPIASADKMPYQVDIGRWGDKQTLREALAELDSEKNRAFIRNHIMKHPGCTGFIVNDEAAQPT